MPRKPSDKIITHRIEFSPVERKFLAEMQQQNKINDMFKRVQTSGSAFSGLAIPVGVGVVAVAFWRWAGGANILEEIPNAIVGAGSKLGNWMDDTLFDGAIKEYTGINDAEAALAAIKDLEAECAALIEEQNKILSSPNSSENQKAQATANIRQIEKQCAQEKKRLNDLIQKFLKRADKGKDVITNPIGTVLKNLFG